MKKKFTASPDICSGSDAWAIVCYAILLFLAMTVQTGRMTMILTGIALIATFPAGRQILTNAPRNLSVSGIALLLFALIQGLAAIYGPFGGYAVKEYYKFLAAFTLTAMLLVRGEKKHIPGLLWSIGAVCSLIALVCIDMGGSTHIFGLFLKYVQTFDAAFDIIEEISDQSRIQGIYNDANITGAILGISLLLQLYLFHQARRTREQFLAALLLGISAIGFLTAMSRGAMACFAVAVLCCLVAFPKEKRIHLFFLLLCSAAAITVTGIPAMTHLHIGSPVPTLMAFLCGPLLFCLYRCAGQKIADRLSVYGKATLVGCGVLAAVLLVLGILAFRTEAPFVFSSNGLHRSVPLTAGDYTLSGVYSQEDSVHVIIYSQTHEQQLLSTKTDVYDGPAQNAVFQITDQQAQVYFRFYGPDGSTASDLVLSDGTRIMSGYKWLPESVASRLHDGLFHSHNFQQRLQYYRDGWKIFLAKPLFGHGLGGSAGMLTAVQPYYYESKYLHNHLLQNLTDTGLVGTAVFLTAMLGIVCPLVNARKAEHGPLAAILLGCLVMMNTHSLLDINFSVRPFQCLAYPLLAIMSIFADPVPLKQKKRIGGILAALLWIYLAVFGGLLLSHRSVEQEMAVFRPTDAKTVMSALERFTERDVFDRETAQINYVGNAVMLKDDQYEATANRYRKALRNSGTYTACSALARYYYLPNGDWENLFACSREGIAQCKSVKESWNNEFLFYRTEVLPAMGRENIRLFVEYVLEIMDYYNRFQEFHMETIPFSRENLAFMDAVNAVAASGMTDEEAYNFLANGDF